MTPMQILKNQFDTFKGILPPAFKEKALNKSEDRTHVTRWDGEVTVHEMKGVRSDFIKTYKAKFNDVDSYSIGFAFKYLDIPKEEYTVQVSLKVGNKNPDFYFGKELGIADFKSKFIETMAKMNNVVDYKQVINLFQEDFNLLPEVHLKDKKKLKI